MPYVQSGVGRMYFFIRGACESLGSYKLLSEKGRLVYFWSDAPS
jgi:hypothetical protein